MLTTKADRCNEIPDKEIGVEHKLPKYLVENAIIEDMQKIQEQVLALVPSFIELLGVKHCNSQPTSVRILTGTLRC